MDQIFGLSYDCDSFPTILPQQISGSNDRFCIAWYSHHNNVSTILKKVGGENFSNLAFVDGKNILSSIYMGCSLELQQFKEKENIPPYKITYADRDWVWLSIGAISNECKKNFILGRSPIFSPGGVEIEEYLLCLLVNRIQSENLQRLSDLSWPVLHGLLQSINQFGVLDLILSDGEDLIAYHDLSGKTQLYCGRFCPPHREAQLSLGKISISFDGIDLKHTFVLFSNQTVPFHADLVWMSPGQMMVARRGDIIWDSVASVLPSTQIREEVVTKNSSVLAQNFFIPLPFTSDETKSSKNVYICTSSPDANPFVFLIEHVSHYHYSSPVYLSKHLFRLQPIHDQSQYLLYYKLTVSVNGKSGSFQGVFGNNATTFEVSEPYSDFVVTSQSLVSVSESLTQRFDLLHQQWSIPLIWMPWDQIMMQAYLTPPELPASNLMELSEYAMSFVKRNNYDVIEVLNDINQTIYRDYYYVAGSTNLSTTPFDIYVNRRGVCQDFANLFICLARLLNIPARYRVGYLYTGADYGNKIQSEASHAWVEFYLPNIGWIGYDPTNCCSQTKNHIRVASGRNYGDAAPTSGTIFKGGGIETLYTTVKVTLKEVSFDTLLDLANQ